MEPRERATQPLEPTADFLQTALSRRRLLRAGAVGVAAVGVAPLLAACGGGDEDATATTAATSAPSGATPTTAPAGGASPTTSGGGASPTTAAASPTSAAASPTTAEATATTSAPAPTGSGGSLIFGTAAEPDSLDPQRTVSGGSNAVFNNIFDCLVTANAEGGFDPIIAEKYEIGEDGVTFTWHIRDGMTFHDGSPVTAADVKYTFDRATNPDAPSQVVSFISALSKTDMPDDKTIVMTLSEASGPFMSNIAVSYFGILPQAATEAAGDDFGTNPVGSGPWVFKEWISGESLTMTAFEDYQEVRTFVNTTGRPAADELIFKFILESQTLLAAFETGDINIIVVPNDQVANYQDNSDYQILITPGGTNIDLLGFALIQGQGETYDPQFKPPFDDIALRQAVAYGVNYQEIIDKILVGLADRDFGPMPTGLFAYDPAIEQYGYHYDADKANSLLDQAGWAMGDDGVRAKGDQRLELSFWGATDPTGDKVAQVFQNQLAQIGMKLNLNLIELGTFIAQVGGSDYDLWYIGIGWPEADILTIISTAVQFGTGFYKPAAYWDLLTKARTTYDLDERKQFYFQAQQMFLKDLPAIPCWTELTALGSRAEVKGMTLLPLNVPNFIDAYVEE